MGKFLKQVKVSAWCPVMVISKVYILFVKYLNQTWMVDKSFYTYALDRQLGCFGVIYIGFE